MKEHLIDEVIEDSLAYEAGVRAGDILTGIGGETVEDVFDYRFLMEEENIVLNLRRHETNEPFDVSIKKDMYDDIGLVFDNGLMDDYRSCTNKCIFCFIDQNAPGMRDTIYFKDDDSRLSFLQGNYVTLTNLKEEHLEKIIKYRLSPINVSVHTTEPDLRCMMLHNRFAGDALEKVRRLYEAGIAMNGQIVLCKGVNDGEHLRRSIEDLMKYAPLMESLSVVPAGLTRYREGLYPLEQFTRDEAAAVIDTIDEYQKKAKAECGMHFVHASDEFYLLAGRDMPAEETYDGYLQLENGVGMIRLLRNEFTEELSQYEATPRKKKFSLKQFWWGTADNTDDRSVPAGTVSIACGESIAPTLKDLASIFNREFPDRKINVFPIKNEFFGGHITVTGLLTGGDILAQLKGQELGSRLILSSNMLRSGEDVFLDDMTVEELGRELGIEIRITDNSGADLIDAICGR